jgi:DNA-binding FadR family transcriptional regulator
MPIGERVHKQSVADAIAGQILNWIREGTLQAGQQLPSEKDLIRQMGVSRPAVREALRGLAVLGVIHPRQGAGYFVADDSPFTPLHVDSLRSALAQIGVFEINEVSQLLETGIAALATERATPDDVGSLQANLADCERLIESGEIAHDALGQFHRLLAEISRNKALVEITKLMHRICMPGERVLHESHLVDEVVILEEHRAIVAAISARDVMAARQAMEPHLQSMRNEYERALARRLVPEATADCCPPTSGHDTASG